MRILRASRRVGRWLALAGSAALVGASEAPGPSVRLMTLDPGHFHAGLFQKEMLTEIDPRVHIFAPLGPDLLAHLNRVSGFNARAVQPTRWEIEVHAAPDFFARMLAERPGNVVVVSGANRDKIARLEAIVGAGLHLLADKPWIISPEEIPALERTLKSARTRGVAAYDGMTQRYEIAFLVQKSLVNDAAVFGTCQSGTEQEPAVMMESVHFLRKEVAGSPLLRPPWFFDSRQQGEPLADIGTHCVDLVLWMLSSERGLDPQRDVQVLRGTTGTIELTRAQFQAVTGVSDFPPALRDAVHGGQLRYPARNTVSYAVRGVQARLEVRWDYEAPPGGRDTELSIFRGTRARVEVRQGREENYEPEVFVVPNDPGAAAALEAALRRWSERVQPAWPGVAWRRDGARFHVSIPAALRVGHEAHFALLVRQFLTYQKNPDLLPAWEDSFMLAKYRVTTEGVRLGRGARAGGLATTSFP